MKTITSSISGLASSLLLNIGLTHVAQALDPVSFGQSETLQEAMSVAFCTPSSFASKSSQ